jgi:curli biogenesis system outer membrane secretion channel CsgG
MPLVVADAEAASGERIRLGIVGFTSKAEGVTQAQAGVIADLFTRTLASSRKFSIMEREQIERIGEELRFNMSGLVDPSDAVEIGRIRGLQYMLLGSVTELNQGASVSGFSIFIEAKQSARATLDVRVIDVETAEVLYTFVETGTAENKSSAVSIGGFTNVEAQLGGIEARAIADAVNRLAHDIRSTIGEDYSYVTSKSGREVRINVGSSLGVQPGTLYLVYEDGVAETDLSGRVLGRNKLPIAVVKVDSVQNEFSICTVAAGTKGDLIQRGDKIDPISASDARTMVNRKQFLSARPTRRAYDDTYAQLFGGEGSEPEIAAQPPAAAPAPVAVAPQPVAYTPPPEPAPVAPAPQPVAITPLPAPIPVPAQTIDGIDPNQSTDPRVVETYPLPPGTINILKINHTNAQKKFADGNYEEAYAEYSTLAERFDVDYLAAYWAGRSAQELNNRGEAMSWFDRAARANPNYRPVIEARGRL